MLLYAITKTRDIQTYFKMGQKKKTKTKKTKKKTDIIENFVHANMFRPFCANCGIVDDHVCSMHNMHFREENSFVLPKPYLAEVYIEHAHQLTT